METKEKFSVGDIRKTLKDKVKSSDIDEGIQYIKNAQNKGKVVEESTKDEGRGGRDDR